MKRFRYVLPVLGRYADIWETTLNDQPNNCGLDERDLHSSGEPDVLAFRLGEHDARANLASAFMTFIKQATLASVMRELVWRVRFASRFGERDARANLASAFMTFMQTALASMMREPAWRVRFASRFGEHDARADLASVFCEQVEALQRFSEGRRRTRRRKWALFGFVFRAARLQFPAQ